MDFSGIPSGLEIRMSLSDKDATVYAEKYLIAHKDQIKELIRKKLSVSLDISDPKIEFGMDEITLSVRAGIKLVKITAAANAAVIWNGSSVIVNVKKLDVPIVSVEPGKVNDLIKKPIQDFVSMLQQSFVIGSFRICNGCISIQATKK